MSFGGWRAWRIKIMSRIMSRSWQQKVSVYGQPQAEHIHITSTRSTTPCMRWLATKPAMARPSRVCSSGTSAEKNQILFEKRGLHLERGAALFSRSERQMMSYLCRERISTAHCFSDYVTNYVTPNDACILDVAKLFVNNLSFTKNRAPVLI